MFLYGTIRGFYMYKKKYNESILKINDLSMYIDVY